MNRKVKSVIFASTLVLYFNACKQRIGNESFVITKDGNGNLQSEIHYINDTIINGVAKYYYSSPSNVLMEEVEYKNGLKDGLYKHFRKDGTLESKTYFKRNVPNGFNSWFYEDGKPKEETFWLNGKQYGSGKWYYKNEKLETFNATDFYDNVFYVVKYDEQGNKTKEDGIVYSTKYIAEYTNDTTQTQIVEDAIKSNKEIVVKITIAQPPLTKTVIRMGELDKDNFIELPINDYTALYKGTFKAGKHTLITIGEIKDLKGNLLKHDSTAVILNVID